MKKLNRMFDNASDHILHQTILNWKPVHVKQLTLTLHTTLSYNCFIDDFDT